MSWSFSLPRLLLHTVSPSLGWYLCFQVPNKTMSICVLCHGRQRTHTREGQISHPPGRICQLLHSTYSFFLFRQPGPYELRRHKVMSFKKRKRTRKKGSSMSNKAVSISSEEGTDTIWKWRILKAWPSVFVPGKGQSPKPIRKEQRRLSSTYFALIENGSTYILSWPAPTLRVSRGMTGLGAGTTGSTLICWSHYIRVKCIFNKIPPTSSPPSSSPQTW